MRTHQRAVRRERPQGIGRDFVTHHSIRRIAIRLVCALVIVIPMQEVHALLGLFYAEAKIKTESEFIAGLDEPTRKLIAVMPETVRKEVVELLRQGLPLVEKSMRDFINDLDTRLERRINQLVCSGQAVGQGVAEEVKGVIVGQRPTPVRELMDGYDGRGKTFKAESARSIAIDYLARTAAQCDNAWGQPRIPSPHGAVAC